MAITQGGGGGGGWTGINTEKSQTSRFPKCDDMHSKPIKDILILNGSRSTDVNTKYQ